MKTNILSTLFVMSFAAAALASETKTVEAFVDQSYFTGTKYVYRVTGYGASSMEVKPVSECETVKRDNQKFLKGIKVKLMLTAEFDRPEAHQSPAMTGEFDVRNAINNCLKDTNSKQGKSPIEVELPRISVPSHLIDPS